MYNCIGGKGKIHCPELILATYCMHIALFEKKVLYYVLKIPKNTCCLGVEGGVGVVQPSKCPKCWKNEGGNSQVIPFAGLSCPFSVLLHAPLDFSDLSIVLFYKKGLFQ